MPNQPQQFIVDGFGSLLGGMNSSVVASLTPDGQVANAVNVAFRGGKPANRSAFIDQAFVYLPVYAADGTTITTSAAAVGAAFVGGIFQGAGIYQNADSTWIFASVSGRLYRLTTLASGFQVEDLTPDAGNNPTRPMVWFCQSNDILVMQDGEAVPLLVKGEQVYRSDLAKYQVPIGTVMAYGYGRLWVAIGNNSYMASDLIFEEPDATITFKDGTYLNENSCFSLPPSFGNVVAMKFIMQQDTATGQGPLIVFGENGAEAVNVTLPREQWLNTQIQVEALTQIGACGHRSLTAVNGDLWFRAPDGIRSYRQARAEIAGNNQVPQSTRVRTYTDLELPELLAYGSAISFDNRLLVTCNPNRSNGPCVHTGLLSLDFDVVTTGVNGFGVDPAWDGYWTGAAPILQLVTGTFNSRQRALMFTCVTTFNSDGTATYVNGLSEIMAGGTQDSSGRITSMLETKAFNCNPAIGANAPWWEKRLEFCEAWVQNRIGDTELKIAYRQDGSLTYKPLADFVESAPQVLDIGTMTATGPQYTARNRSTTPADTATGSDTRLDRRFYELQLQVTWTGSLRLHRLRISAVPGDDSKRSGQ